MDGFKTTLGKSGDSSALNRTLKDAVEYTHDIFLRAATERLNVYMLCGSLSSELRSALFQRVGCLPFEVLVRSVLDAGRNVSIFAWGDPSTEALSPAFVQLLRDYAMPRQNRGVLDVRAIGAAPDPKLASMEVTHFLMALGHSEILKMARAYIRIENPHSPFSAADLADHETLAKAALFFNSSESIRQIRKASQAFKKLFAAAGGDITPLDADVKILEFHPALNPQLESSEARLKDRVDQKYAAQMAIPSPDERSHMKPA